jgi:23S rRNA (uracil1939-C5)-methyltransferase
MTTFKTDTIKCPHRFECQGCQSWELNYSEQLEHKKNDLKKKLNNTSIAIQVKTAGSSELRTRFDFTVENQKMGLYGKNKQLIDLSTCFQLAPELNTAFMELKQIIWPFQKGSIRIRISPLKKLGIWFDLANIDIKNLLVEKNLLMNLSKKYFIEIGQKRKALDLNSFHLGQLKLIDPIPQLWFQTKTWPLCSYVSSFTQPSWLTADLITDNILQWVEDMNIENQIIEYGSGIGQYTIPLLKMNKHINIFETDSLALDGLRMNAKDHLNQLSINETLLKEKIDLVLVNPPRSGLKDFTEKIMLHQPKFIIYISCYPESLQEDLKILQTKYQLTKADMIDQFPQTTHYEAMILLQRIN